mgnify:CR=1 FL=1
MRRIMLCAFLFTMAYSYHNKAVAQDPQFSQFYAAPLYLNPALTGINQKGRVGINYRNQWPNINTGFETAAAYVDYNWEEYNSSLGFMILNDQEGFAGLSTTTMSLSYAYQVYLNYDWAFRPAVQISHTWRDVDIAQLTFGDQFDPRTGQIVNPTGEPLSDLSARFFDVNLGGLLFSNRAWAGISFHHVTEPNQSLIGADSSPLPRRFSLHGGYKIPLTAFARGPVNKTGGGRERSVTPAFNYRAQGDFDQLDLGVYFTLQPMLIGMWYRGVPVKQFEGFANNEAVVVLVGFQKNNMSIGYSFDYTLSDLGIGAGGAHEISWSYTFTVGKPKPPREVRELRCPVPFLF